MYNNILNPLTGRKVDIKSRLGKKILKTYLLQTDSQIGGISFKNRGDKYLEHIGTREGHNELIACAACSLNVLGLPINIVNRMSEIARFASTQGVAWLDVNNALNEVKNQSHPSSSWFPPTEIYIWGTIYTDMPDPLPRELEISVARYNELGGSFRTGFVIKKKKNKRLSEDRDFYPFPGCPRGKRVGQEYFVKTLHNIFNNLNNGSSALLGMIFWDGYGHYVVISKSTQGTPYLIDAQNTVYVNELNTGFARGWEPIQRYFDLSPKIDYLITFNNSKWRTTKDRNFVLTHPEYELNLDIDFEMPRNPEDNNTLQDLNPERNTEHPSRIESYLGTSLPSAVEWAVEARAKAKAVKEAETEGLRKP